MLRIKALEREHGEAAESSPSDMHPHTRDVLAEISGGPLSSPKKNLQALLHDHASKEALIGRLQERISELEVSTAANLVLLLMPFTEFNSSGHHGPSR